jgi:hypothetical protein
MLNFLQAISPRGNNSRKPRVPESAPEHSTTPLGAAHQRDRARADDAA